jgi:hypothetical protein
MHIIATQYVELMDFIQFEAQTALYSKYGCENSHVFCGPCSSGEWDDCESKY